jgi:hypothetical protein
MLYVEERKGKGWLLIVMIRMRTALRCAKIILARKPQEAEIWLWLAAERAEVLMPRSISRWKAS